MWCLWCQPGSVSLSCRSLAFVCSSLLLLYRQDCHRFKDWPMMCMHGKDRLDLFFAQAASYTTQQQCGSLAEVGGERYGYFHDNTDPVRWDWNDS